MIFRPNLSWIKNDFDIKFRTNLDLTFPKITIITPSYNQGKFIEATIRSVLCQNYPNLEYFIFDGGSKDETVEVIKKYEKYIDHWESGPDKGQSDAINKGFRVATGDIVGWLNSDDLFFPNTLHRVANHFKQSEDFQKVLYGEGIYYFDKYNLSIPNNTARLSDRHPIELCDFIIQPSTFWGKSVIDKVGLLSENLHYSFDWEWFIRIHKAGIPFQMVNDNFSVYRIHSEHKSTTSGDKRTKELAQVYQIYHGQAVADSYLKLHGNTKAIWTRRILKRLPIGASLLKKIYWKNGFRTIPFEVFESIILM